MVRISSLSLFALLLGFLLACSASERERMGKDAGQRGAREGVNRAVEEARSNDNDNTNSNANQSGSADANPCASGQATTNGSDSAVLVAIGNTTCPVIDEPVSVVIDVNGYGVGVCCFGCARAVKANPATYRDKLLADTGHDITVPAVQR